MKNKVNSVYDILKIILSIMIVLIHSGVLVNILYPWLRIAVPLFFIMSSYFLFSKLNKESDEKKKKEIVKAFILRNLKLYLIWFIILLPITLDYHKYFINFSLIKGIGYLIRDYLFSSTFFTSWFIMALIEGAIIIYYCSKKINTKILFAISFIVYAFIVITCTYTFIPSLNITKYLRYAIMYPQNSFLVSLIWIMIGKMFADNKINYSSKLNTIILIVSLILLFMEWFFIKEKTIDVTRDCYFMLIPVSISIYYFVLKIKPFYFSQSIFIRKISTVMYVSHKSIIFILMNYLMMDNSWLVIMITITSSILLTVIINFLSKKITFMKNAY